MKLRPESEKLLIALVGKSQDFGGPWSYGLTGALAAVNGGFLPEGGQGKAECCSEQDCSLARSSLLELHFHGLIVLHPADVSPVGLDGQWNWLYQSGVYVIPAGIRYVEQLSYPWYRKWWNKIPGDFKALIITVLGVIIATLLIYYFIPLD